MEVQEVQLSSINLGVESISSLIRLKKDRLYLNMGYCDMLLYLTSNTIDTIPIRREGLRMDFDRAFKMEQLLDSLGMVDFIEMLTSICYEKADHVRTNWQDEGLAKVWEYNAKQLDHLKVKEPY